MPVQEQVVTDTHAAVVVHGGRSIGIDRAAAVDVVPVTRVIRAAGIGLAEPPVDRVGG